MCIFSDEVISVSNTEIFVSRLKKYKNFQITIYQNNLASKNKNAMILPIPSCKNIGMLDLSLETDLFDQLNTFFKVEKEIQHWGMDYMDDVYFAIHEIGAYKISFVPNVDGFSRVDPETFKMGDNVKNALYEKYSEGFSFLICSFNASKNMKMHPIGYIHKMRNPKELFVPTLHIHDGKVHPQGDFDHQIFAIDVVQKKLTVEKSANAINYMKKTSFRHMLKIEDDSKLFRVVIKGEYKNQDILLECE